MRRYIWSSHMYIYIYVYTYVYTYIGPLYNTLYRDPIRRASICKAPAQPRRTLESPSALSFNLSLLAPKTDCKTRHRFFLDVECQTADKTQDQGRRTEDGGRRTEDGGWRTEDRRQIVCS